MYTKMISISLDSVRSTRFRSWSGPLPILISSVTFASFFWIMLRMLWIDLTLIYCLIWNLSGSRPVNSCSWASAVRLFRQTFLSHFGLAPYLYPWCRLTFSFPIQCECLQTVLSWTLWVFNASYHWDKQAAFNFLFWVIASSPINWE